MMSRWLIVRHGETQWNAEGRVQGHTDVSLSARGMQQAEALRDRLATWDIHAAYSSDLVRAMDTARTLLQGRDVTISPSPEIREFAFGRWEGLTGAQIKETDPVMFDDWRIRGDTFAPPGGESVLDLADRVRKFLGRVKGAHGDGEVVLIVGHGGCLTILLTCLLELPLSTSRRLYFDSASLSVVDVYHDTAVLKLLNDTSHWSTDGPGSRW